MAILPRSGRAAIAAAIKDQPLHLAWGLGSVSWGDAAPPAENADATALLSEVGRRKVTSVQFVTAATNGDIEIVGAGRFSISATPTNKLYIKTQFDFTDASDKVIREIALFMNTETNSGLPAGQMYFTPDQITDPGTMIQLEHKLPIYRSSGTRQMFEILLVI